MKIRGKSIHVVLLVAICLMFGACGGGGGSSSSPAPEVVTVSPSSVSLDNAVLNGTVNPNGVATTAWFEYGTSSSLVTSTETAHQSIGTGTANVNVHATVTGLTYATAYYYRVVASSANGTTRGSIVQFTTATPNDPPAVSTSAATEKTVNSAKLNGSVIPNGLATTAWFQYSTNSSLATPTETTAVSVGTDLVSHQFNQTITGLNIGTTYYYRIAANNLRGTAYGSIASFETNALAPTVTTDPADPVGFDNAILQSTVNPNGLATTARFQYATSNNLSDFTLSTGFTQSDNVTIGSQTTDQTFDRQVTGLTEHTTYYYRVIANNSAGTQVGTVRSFNTTYVPGLTANAGANQVVYMLGPSGISNITLDGTGSTGPQAITGYQWTQLSGANTVTLVNATSDTPAFEAPVLSYPPTADDNLVFGLTVTDSRGLTSTDNVSVDIKWGYLDDFSVDSTGTYTKTDTWTAGGTGTFSLSSGTGRITTGNDVGLMVEHEFGPSFGANQGVFSFNFTPTAKYSAGSGIEIRLGDIYGGIHQTCFVISTIDNVVQKWFNGTKVQEVAFTPTYSTGTDYWIKVKVDDVDGLTVTGFGQTVNLSNTQPLPLVYYWLTLVEQDGNFDNITLDVVY